MVISPATIFLLFLSLFRVCYVHWAERNAKPIAEAQWSAESGYEITIDSVEVRLSALRFLKVRVWQHGEQIGQIDSLLLEEPSLLSLMVKRQLVARHAKVSGLQTHCNEVRKFFQWRNFQH